MYPGKIVLLHSINENIIISRLSYSGLYQDEEKLELYKVISSFWVRTPKKPDKMSVQLSL